MSQYDEHKYKRSSGSAPRPQPQEPLEPPANPLFVTEEDDPIVQCAAEIYEDGVRRNEEMQVHGHQAGFGKTSVEGVVQAARQPAQEMEEAVKET